MKLDSNGSLSRSALLEVVEESVETSLIRDQEFVLTLQWQANRGYVLEKLSGRRRSVLEPGDLVRAMHYASTTGQQSQNRLLLTVNNLYRYP